MIVVEPMDEDRAFETEMQREVDAEAQAARDVKDSDWWAERLGDVSIASNAATAIAWCMANLDAACNGCPISRDAVLTALSNLQKQAKADALDVARLA